MLVAKIEGLSDKENGFNSLNYFYQILRQRASVAQGGYFLISVFSL